MDRRQENGELVALSAAAAFVYRQVMGAAIPPGDVAQVNAILHDVAHAIANVAPVYGAKDGDVPSPVPPLELMHGAFQRGATVLRTPQGSEYQGLSIQRAQMVVAVTILKRAGVKFTRPCAPK